MTKMRFFKTALRLLPVALASTAVACSSGPGTPQGAAIAVPSPEATALSAGLAIHYLPSKIPGQTIVMKNIERTPVAKPFAERRSTQYVYRAPYSPIYGSTNSAGLIACNLNTQYGCYGTYASETARYFISDYFCTNPICPGQYFDTQSVSATNLPPGVSIGLSHDGGPPAASVAAEPDSSGDDLIELVVTSDPNTMPTASDFNVNINFSDNAGTNGPLAQTLLAPTIEKTYIVQTVQDGTVGLAANKQGEIRAFVGGSPPGDSQPAQPLDANLNGSDIMIPPPTTYISSSTFDPAKTPGVAGASYDNYVPASSIGYQNTLKVNLLDNNGNKLTYPGASATFAPTTYPVPNVHLGLVAVNIVGTAFSGKPSHIDTTLLPRVYPIPQINVDTDSNVLMVDPADLKDVAHAQSVVVGKLAALGEPLDQSNLLVAVLPAHSGYNFGGSSPLNSYTPLVVDDTGSVPSKFGETLTFTEEALGHEMGHAYGLNHTTCSPLIVSKEDNGHTITSDGTAQVYAWDFSTGAVVQNSYSYWDLMAAGYCGYDESATAVNANNLLKLVSGQIIHVTQSTTRSTESTRSKSDIAQGPVNQSLYPYTLQVSGTTSPLALLPASTNKTTIRQFSVESGPYTVTGTDSSGAVLFTQSFTPNFDDEQNHQQDFDFFLPITATAYTNLKTLTVSGNGATSSQTSAASGPPVATAVSTGNGMITVTWNGSQYPRGEVVSNHGVYSLIASGSLPLSTATIPGTASTLLINFSDNVKTTQVSVSVL